MVYARPVDRPQVSRCIVLYLALMAFLPFLCFWLYNFYHEISLDKQLPDFAVSGSDPMKHQLERCSQDSINA